MGVVLEQKVDEPKDRYYIVTILFFFLGLVHILPWSFFVTANEYWMYKFRNTSIDDSNSEFRTSLQKEFAAVLTITLTVADISFLFLCMFLGHYFKARTRVVFSLLVILILMIAAMIFVEIDTDSWQTAFYAITMVIVFGVSAMNAIFGMTMYTILSLFPESYLAPYLNGQGLSGIFSASLQILSLAGHISVEADALLYFGLGVLVNAFTLILLLLTKNNKLYSYYIKDFQEGQKEKVITYEEFKIVFGKMWPSLAIMLFWILTVGPVHSSVTSLVVSEGEGQGIWNDTYFVPTCTFLIPAIMDLIGRVLASKFKLNIGSIWLVVFSFVRMLIFVPLLVFCNAQPRNNLSVIFPYDYQYILIMIFFAVSNGYLMSTCSFIIPKLVDQDEVNNAFQVYMVGTGLLLGILSPIGFFFVNII